MDSIVTGTSDAVFVKDRQGRYLMANAAAAAFVGKTPSQLLGLDDSALFDAVSARSLHETDAAILAAGEVQTHIEQLTIQNGENLVFMVTKGPVLDKRGAVIGLFGISRDITHQQQAPGCAQSERGGVAPCPASGQGGELGVGSAKWPATVV